MNGAASKKNERVGKHATEDYFDFLGSELGAEEGAVEGALIG